MISPRLIRLPNFLRYCEGAPGTFKASRLSSTLGRGHGSDRAVTPMTLAGNIAPGETVSYPPSRAHHTVLAILFVFYEQTNDPSLL